MPDLPRRAAEDAFLAVVRASPDWGEIVWRPRGSAREETVIRYPAPADLFAPRAEEIAPPAKDGRASSKLEVDLRRWRQITWPGVGTFALNAAQARVVAVLLLAWEEGRPDVSQRVLLREAGTDCARLGDLFRHVPGWERLVVPGEAPGDYRLAEPDGGPLAD